MINRVTLIPMCVALVTGCSAGGSSAPPAPTSTPSTGPSSAPSPTPTPPPLGSTKSAINGLIDMGDITFHNSDTGVPPTPSLADLTAFPGIFGGVVINVTWAQLQSVAGAPIDTAPIDAALAEIRQYNIRFPQAPLAAKLRVWPGTNAPPWAKALDGGPITAQRNRQAGTVTFGHWWMPDYRAAWQAVQQQLAAAYDREPLVREVSITSCSSQTDEPFVASADDAGLRAAGYTDTLAQTCLSNAYRDYAAWRATRIDYTFNVFIHGDSGVTPKSDPAFTQGVMTAFRAALGARGTVMNHYLSAPVLGTDANVSVYTTIAALGPPIEFQTQSPGQSGFDWDSTVALAVTDHANALEIWPAVSNGFLSLAPATVQRYAQELAVNALP